MMILTERLRSQIEEHMADEQGDVMVSDITFL